MIVAYHVYDADTRTRLNEQPIPIEEVFDWDGRAAGTVYRIYTTNLDQAGNESEPSPVVEVQTEAFEPTEGPMPSELTAQIDAIVGQAMADGAGPGVGVHVTSPLGYYAKAYGISTSGVPLTTDMHFRIGSATKPFSAMAVLMAVQKGLISLEDTIDQFDTPEFQLSRIANSHKIKIRHLMMMRSGVFNEQRDFNYMLNLGLLFTKSAFSDQARFGLTVGHPASFEPGTQFEYINDNWFILSLVLKAVTGRHIRDIIHEDICAPLGLTETSWPATAKMPAPFAVGHGGLLGGANQITTEVHPSYAHAAGAIVSTMADMSKWCAALRDGALLSPEMYELWMTQFCPIPLGGGFGPPEVGYGMAMYDYGEWKGHAGSWVGYECSPMFHPPSGSIIVCFENSQTVGTNGVGVQTFSQIFPEIAKLIAPGSMDAKTYTSCAVPADPFVGKVAPANLGYRGVSAPIIGLGSAAGSFTAPAGADVFLSVAWDRTGQPQMVTYGGVEMSRIAVAYHSNTADYGGQALYRLAGAGSGAAKAVSITGAGGWVTAYGSAFENVQAVGTPSVNFGNGVVHSQAVSAPGSAITLQAFSAGAYGAPMYALDAIRGGRNRAQTVGTHPLLWVNTAIGSGEVSALSSAANRWASIAVNIAIAVDVDAKPLPAVVKVAGGQPALVVDVANKVITPTKASLSISGGRPGGEALFPAGAALSVTGGTPTVEVKAAFEPFTEENVNRTNTPVPSGATGAWVTLGGAGGGGGSGRRSNSGYRYGGGGGGGGAYVDRVFVPVELMGDTYTVTRGLGGNGGSKSYSGDGSSGSNGGDSSFISGDVSLIAGGGKAGARGTNSSGSGDGGSGGTASVSGASASTYNGGNGGNGGSSPTNGQSRSNGAGAGGGGAGGMLSNDNTFNSASAGSSSGPAGNGGNGSRGGSGTGTNAGSGGDGYNKIEWSNLPDGGA
ncbi:minor tail protein [Mycobacterium phage Lucky2013]|uniref:Minor tail protein n=2 Tax=Omegavirus courthouse TaxID=1089119 RepID=G8I594_9CAUD|nr:minor tail protein [Mycobacterium phage Courthouse]YP_009205167.1 minor tail protein [Mycobacterium phage Ariel]YP_009213254.1 minor tail protein [Mycobacterium phage MiaZeal]ASD50675.1 minor tail protein [Mycobacterium phage Porcelain]ASD53430.1 minor tail protein [Mycobacterium phage Lucky2013]ASZ74112.1 minor tail protein [Mycobacterium phage Squint]ATS92880.1 minor tail protein [Mycobacterium phage Superphikiman]AER47888.1 minor tail protein [Mycobacterium phage Courthouse]